MEKMKLKSRAKLTQVKNAKVDKNATVVGMGYVGQSLSLGLADSGWSVMGLDQSQERLDQLSSLSFDALPNDKDRFATYLHKIEPLISLTNLPSAISESAVVFICVPTPTTENYAADYRALELACQAVVNQCVKGQLIILCSTTSVGSTQRLLVEPLFERGLITGKDIFVGYSPERVDPGNTSFSSNQIPRVVAGYSEKCSNLAFEVVSDIASQAVMASSLEAAEMSKLVENTFRAVNIAWANEVADVAQHANLDSVEVLELASTKPYGFMKFSPGPGVGGHCIPSDPHFFLDKVPVELAPLTITAMTKLHSRPKELAESICAALLSMGKSRVTILGVAYKPNVADVRDSPAIEVIGELIRRGFSVKYLDPHVPKLRLSDGGILRANQSLDVSMTDLAVVMTYHREFSDFEFQNFSIPVIDHTFSLKVEGSVSRGPVPPINPQTKSDESNQVNTQTSFGLSILIPAFNEENTILETLEKLSLLSIPGTPIELIVVDDGSTDGTSNLIRDFIEDTQDRNPVNSIRHGENLGKGAAIQSGLAVARGKYFIIFDADAEYSVEDLEALVVAAVKWKLDIVYGVRLAGHNALLPSFIHALGNRVLTFLANIMFGSWLSDLHTCLKLFSTDLLKSLELKETGFGLDTEITAISLRLGYRPFEVPSSYVGRTKAQGKKIGLADAFVCVWVLLKVRIKPVSRLKLSAQTLALTLNRAALDKAA